MSIERVGWIKAQWDYYIEVPTQKVAGYYQCLLVTAFQLLTRDGLAALASYSPHNVSLLASLWQQSADLSSPHAVICGDRHSVLSDLSS